MNIFSIFGVVMGILMISLCTIYARTKKVGCNNIFTMLLLSMGAIALTTLTVIFPKWWIVGIELYAFFVAWFYLGYNYEKVEKCLSVDFTKNKSRIILRDSSNWLCSIILVVIPVTILLRCWSTPVGFVFIPIGVVSMVILFAALHNALKDVGRLTSKRILK